MQKEGTRITPFHYFCPYMQAIIVHNSNNNVLITWQLCDLQNLEPFLTCEPAEIIVPMDFCRDFHEICMYYGIRKGEHIPVKQKKIEGNIKTGSAQNPFHFFRPYMKVFFG